MSRARYHSMESPRPSRVEKPLGSAISAPEGLRARKPTPEQQRSRIRLLPPVPSSSEHDDIAEDLENLRQKMAMHDNGERLTKELRRDDDRVSILGEKAYVGKNLHSDKPLDLTPVSVETFRVQNEYRGKQYELAKLEQRIEKQYGYSAYELDQNPNLANKRKGLGRLAGWLLSKIGKSTDAELNTVLNQWRLLDREVETLASFVDVPTGQSDGPSVQEARARRRAYEGRGGMSLEEQSAHNAEIQADRVAAKAIPKSRASGDNAYATWKKSLRAHEHGHHEAAKALEENIIEQQFFTDGLALDDLRKEHLPSSEAHAEATEAITRAVREEESANKRRATELSDEDIETLTNEQINSKLARNMASDAELEAGRVKMPAPIRQGRRIDVAGLGNVVTASAVERRGAVQHVGQKTHEAPVSSEAEAFKALLDDEEHLLGQAKSFDAKKKAPTDFEMNSYSNRMAKIQAEVDRLTGTPGLDQTESYKKGMVFYNDLKKYERKWTKMREEANKIKPVAETQKESLSELAHKALLPLYNRVVATQMNINRFSLDKQPTFAQKKTLVTLLNRHAKDLAKDKEKFESTLHYQFIHQALEDLNQKLASFKEVKPATGETKEALTPDLRKRYIHAEQVLGKRASEMYQHVVQRFDTLVRNRMSAEKIQTIQETVGKLMELGGSASIESIAQRYVTLLADYEEKPTPAQQKMIQSINKAIGFRTNEYLQDEEALVVLGPEKLKKK